MAKPRPKTFKSNAGGPITIHVSGFAPITLEPGGSYEATDPRQIDVLKSSSDVSEVKETKGKKKD